MASKLKQFLHNLPADRSIQKIIRDLTFDTARATMKFNIRRLTETLPTREMKSKWYGDDPTCTHCHSNIETQRHLFECPAKSNVLKRLHDKMNILGKTYTKQFSIPTENLISALTQGFFDIKWLNSILHEIPSDLRKFFIRAMITIITTDCCKAFWNHTFLG